MERFKRKVGISCRQSLHEYFAWQVQEVDFTARTQLGGACAIIFPLTSCPKTKVEYDINAQDKNTCRNFPEHGFNERVPLVVSVVFRILTKKTCVPCIQ